MHQSQNQTRNALIAQRIDKQIFAFIRNDFTDRCTLSKLSIAEQIKAYEQFGQHKIDFSKIYDLE